MDEPRLMDPGTWPLAAALALVALPSLFILFSRRAAWWSKLLWIGASQLSWALIILYTELLPEHLLPARGWRDVLGWWTYAFPWAIYLLYRATRDWFPGERRAEPPQGPGGPGGEAPPE